MNHDDERDYAEEAANRALLREEEADDDTRTISADLASIHENGIYIAEYGEDAPQGGDSMHWRSLIPRDRQPYDGVRVEYLLIGATGWGDYSGSTWSRSNYRVLERDYREHLIEVYDSLGTKQWAVPIGAEVPEALYDNIKGLEDYPILEEEDEYEVVNELELECWESFGRHDFYSELETLAHTDDPDDQLLELDDHDALKALFEEAREECDYRFGNFESESATSGYWTDSAELARVAWRLLRDTRDGVRPIPGQLVLI